MPKRKDIQWLQTLALQMNGKCLSEKYINSSAKYLWRCEGGHEWVATANSVQQKKWCPFCSKKRPHNLSWLNELAKERGGKCHATEYKNNHTKVTWECKKGHVWEAKANSIQQGKWCPRCVRRVSSAENRLFLSVLRRYPDALSNKTGLLPNRRFELDIYIPSLKKAIEFDGDYWHNRVKAIERDKRKNLECREAGIGLLRVKWSDWETNSEEVLKQVFCFIGEKQWQVN